MNPIQESPVSQFLPLQREPKSCCLIEDDAIAQQRKKIPKGKEAEDALRPRPRLMRQASAQQLGRITIQKSEKEEIAAKQGVLWECIGRTPNKLGGYIYKYKLKKEYDDVTCKESSASNEKNINAKLSEIFPAIELSGSSFQLLDPKFKERLLNNILQQNKEKERTNPGNIGIANRKVEKICEKILHSSDFFQLGYSPAHDRNYLDEFRRLGFGSDCGGDAVYLSLPDKEALLANWNALRAERPALPDLNIFSSEGIADDITFVEAFFSYDTVLSGDKEFVHDMHVHVTPLIFMMLDSQVANHPPYNQTRWRFVKLVAIPYRRIMLAENKIPKDKLKKMEVALGAFTDRLSVAFDHREAQRCSNDLLEFHFIKPFYQPRWGKYIKNRFPGENLSISKLSSLWKKITALEKTFDDLRNTKKSIE